MISRLLQSESLPKRHVLLAVSLMLGAWLTTVSSAEPSRKETIQFIADKINQQGTVNVASYTHDNATGKDSIARWSFEQSKVAIDPHKKCKLTYHKKTTFNGTVQVDSDFWAMLGAVNKAEVIPVEQAWKLADAKAGNTTLSYKADPQVFMLRLSVANGNYYEIAFYEQDLAGRVEKAFEHLIDVCGGGKEVF
jgi:hypothetical protein